MADFSKKQYIFSVRCRGAANLQGLRCRPRPLTPRPRRQPPAPAPPASAVPAALRPALKIIPSEPEWPPSHPTKQTALFYSRQLSKNPGLRAFRIQQNRILPFDQNHKHSLVNYIFDSLSRCSQTGHARIYNQMAELRAILLKLGHHL